MKKAIVLFLAIITGAILSMTVLKMSVYNANQDEIISVYVLQLGKYKERENALKKQAEVENSVVVEDKGAYLVLAGASFSLENLKKVEDILDKRDIHYYKKKVLIQTRDVNDLKKYNLLLDKAREEETIVFLNQKILESVREDGIFD